MNIKGKPGSKERLLEMFQGVNKIKINEEFGYEEYKGDVGDRYKDSEGNEFTVADKVKGGVTLRGQGGSNETSTGDLSKMEKINEQEEAVVDTKGERLSIGDVVEMDGEIFQVVINPSVDPRPFLTPFDMESKKTTNLSDRTYFTELQGKAFEKVASFSDTDGGFMGEENVHSQPESDPFGGARQELQDGPGYGDEKPVNPDLRVKGQGLDKFVKEEKWGECGKFKDFEGVMKWTEGGDEPTEEVNEIGIEGGPSSGRIMSPHESDMMMQAVTNLLDRDEPVTHDTIQREFLKISQMNENDEENPEEEVPALDVKDVDQDGDKIEGGLADEEDVMGYDPDQIIKGIEVEMEHTKDPTVALEITMDHLEEIPDYYTRLDKMENDVEVNGAGSTDPENPSGCFPPEVLPPMTGGPETGENPYMELPKKEDLPDDLKGHAEVLQDDDQLKDTILGFDVETPNASEEFPMVGDPQEEPEHDAPLGPDLDENDFAARERDYHDTENYKRYQELDARDFNELSDDERDEFFNLWQEFGTSKG